jgi:hypothetical protein
MAEDEGKAAPEEEAGEGAPGEGAPGGEAPQAEEAPPGESPGPTSQEEEELRRRLEQELRKLRVQDVLLQSVVSLINLTSRRIAKPDEQDLDQARVGIEAVRALVDLLEPEPAGQVRQALSELQVAYAREAGGPRGEDEGPEEPGPPEGGAKDRPSGLWTPPGSGG